MKPIAKSVCDFFDLKGMKYTVLNDEDEVIEIIYNGKNMARIRMVLTFDKDEKSIAIHSYSIAKPKDDSAVSKAKAYIACNLLNQKWRWFKFYLDTDDEYTASVDAVIDLYTAGEECYELIQRMTDVIDNSYPLIMQSIWS